MGPGGPVPPVIPPRRRAWPAWLVGAGGLGIGAAVLYFYAPEQHAFYPRCWLYVWTGWQCPGCGGLRALHALLHGHWAAAWQHNALLFVLLPVLGAGLAGGMWRRLTGRPGWRILQRPVWLWLTLAAVALFGLLRNLPRAWWMVAGG